MPIEPLATRWEFPSGADADEHGIVAVGGDLEPGTLLAAYRGGLYPMRLEAEGPVAWWSPDPRGVIPLDGFHVSRSLRRSLARFELRVDTAFVDVMRACADPSRPHGWIDASFIAAYTELHRLGWAHSVETWRDGELVGGVYGVSIGGLFAGESMFHRVTDASKAALVGLVRILRDGGASVFDIQWTTPHLASLGAIDVSRADYTRCLAAAIVAPMPATFAR